MCLLNSVVKTLQKTFKTKWSTPTSRHILIPQIQRYAFALLTNCAQSAECKNIIWKSNLLGDFTAIELNNLNATLGGGGGGGGTNVKLWLRFLLSLSFSGEGQQFFLKVDALLATIVKLVELILKQSQQQLQLQRNNDAREVHYTCLLIMRNLAFNAANKSKLISMR